MRTTNQQQRCRRSEPRRALGYTALAFQAGGHRSVVTVSDISLGGVRIDGASLAYDDEIRLVMPHRGDVNARVRWASASSAGAQLDDELVLDGRVPAREINAIRRLRAFNFHTGRVFGRRSTGGK